MQVPAAPIQKVCGLTLISRCECEAKLGGNEANGGALVWTLSVRILLPTTLSNLKGKEKKNIDKYLIKILVLPLLTITISY